MIFYHLHMCGLGCKVKMYYLTITGHCSKKLETDQLLFGPQGLLTWALCKTLGLSLAVPIKPSTPCQIILQFLVLIPGHSEASLGESLVRSLLPSPGSWCAQGLICDLQESVWLLKVCFSHEIKRRLLPGRKAMTKLDSILKSRDITLPTKARLVKAMVFPKAMYGCESWTIKKADRQKIDAFELWCWRRLLRAPWTARRSN